MSEKRFDKKGCIVLLKNKYCELKEQGLERYPKRSDFAENEVVAIKAFLGPWPRALEEAGVKPKRSDNRLQKNKEKRIRAKRAKIKAKREKQKGTTEE